jgi:hypothetical protein
MICLLFELNLIYFSKVLIAKTPLVLAKILVLNFGQFFSKPFSETKTPVKN